MGFIRVVEENLCSQQFRLTIFAPRFLCADMEQARYTCCWIRWFSLAKTACWRSEVNYFTLSLGVPCCGGKKKKKLVLYPCQQHPTALRKDDAFHQDMLGYLPLLHMPSVATHLEFSSFTTPFQVQYMQLPSSLRGGL